MVFRSSIFTLSHVPLFHDVLTLQYVVQYALSLMKNVKNLPKLSLTFESFFTGKIMF